MTATDDGDTVEGIVALASALERNKTLTALNISSNNLTDFAGKMEGAARPAAALQRNLGLQDLDLSDNCFGSVGARMLDECIVRNTSLTRLELGMNSGPDGTKHIAAATASALSGCDQRYRIIVERDNRKIWYIDARACFRNCKISRRPRDFVATGLKA